MRPIFAAEEADRLLPRKDDSVQVPQADSRRHLEWNKAFEKAGFTNAIEVRQQPDNDDRDPEDMRYNIFRWITSDAGFAMGPSRVNPNTGQILDADIIFDADFLSVWKEEYETFTPPTVAEVTGGALPIGSTTKPADPGLFADRAKPATTSALLGYGMPRQLAFGSAAIDGYAADRQALEARTWRS